MTVDRRAVASLAVLGGLVLLVVGAIYLADPARSLPSFFPGHQAGSARHHVKHAIAALVVALGCFAYAWFATGPAGSARRRAA